MGPCIRRVTLLSALLLVASHAACGGPSEETRTSDEGFEPPPPGPSWAPRPEKLGGLSAVAQASGEKILVHTEHGDVDFLPGVNLGSSTPGHQPGEVAITAEDVRRWLPLMADLGFRAVRVYTILPPAFYDELLEYNETHENRPLYLIQGVYLPDESYVDKGDLFDPAVTTAFQQEIRDAAAVVHGDFTRPTTRGRASGTWTADVTPWLVGWLIGAELDPEATKASDSRNADKPAYRGRYFANTRVASPAERWLAARLDEMAAADAERGHAAPVAFINWPTLDPLTHPEEPLETEDLVGVDANNVQPTDEWPAGTFASYHAYPFYPDFQRLEPGLQIEWDGETDSYAGYLQALKRHHEGMPLMITEFGVPASLGAAHYGARGRNQGNHSEQEALEIDADLLRIIRDLDLAGAFLFAWADEWFKLTWNTVPRQIPADRRQLWHDVLTNEQFYGILANDAVGGDDAQLRVVAEEPEATVLVATDESWVHVELGFAELPDGPISLGFDVVAGGADSGQRPGTTQPDTTSDYTVVVDPSQDEAQAWVRTAVDPVPLDRLPPPDPRDPPKDGWLHQQLTLNRARVVPTTGEKLPAEFYDVGKLRKGAMDPDEDGYDSRATWRVDGDTVTLRIPWGLLGMADPSSKKALVPQPDGTAKTAPVDRIGLTVDAGDQRITTKGIAWEPWQQPHFEERLKVGVQAYVDALADVTPG